MRYYILMSIIFISLLKGEAVCSEKGCKKNQVSDTNAFLEKPIPMTQSKKIKITKPLSRKESEKKSIHNQTIVRNGTAIKNITKLVID